MTKVVDNFALIEVIGSGQYGKVYRGKHLKSGENFAVKCIGLDKYKKVPKLDEFTNNEIDVLTKLVHPNIVRFYERLKTANNVYMVYEFCAGGTLETLIYKTKMSRESAYLYFRHLIEGFKLIANANILHRDIKPSNILVHNNVIKIADFGFCKSLMSGNQMTKTMVGSPIYMAPELLRGDQYSQKADVWSLGVMLYEMLFRCCPFEEKTIPRLLRLIERQPLRFPVNVPEPVKNILIGTLGKSPYQRFAWNDLFEYYDRNFDVNGQPLMSPLPSVPPDVVNVMNNYNILPSGKYQKKPAHSPIDDNLKFMPQHMKEKSEVKREVVKINTSGAGNIINKKLASPPRKQPDTHKILEIPIYFRNTIRDKSNNPQIKDLESLLNSPKLDNIYENLMLQRAKINNLLYSLREINNYGYINGVLMKELFLAIMKKIYMLVVDLNTKLASISPSLLVEYLTETETFFGSINKEMEMFSNLYKKFITECDQGFNSLITNMPLDRVEKMKQEISSPYNFDNNFYQNRLLEAALKVYASSSDEKITQNDAYNLQKILSLANFLLDCMMVDDISVFVFEGGKKPEDQEYFRLLGRFGNEELDSLVRNKIGFVNRGVVP